MTATASDPMTEHNEPSGRLITYLPYLLLASAIISGLASFVTLRSYLRD